MRKGLQGLLPKSIVCPSTEPVLSRRPSFESLRTNGESKGSGRTVVCRNDVNIPIMLSLSKHDIDLGNSPSRH
jgi:hypothetical protein